MSTFNCNETQMKKDPCVGLIEKTAFEQGYHKALTELKQQEQIRKQSRSEKIQQTKQIKQQENEKLTSEERIRKYAVEYLQKYLHSIRQDIPLLTEEQRSYFISTISTNMIQLLSTLTPSSSSSSISQTKSHLQILPTVHINPEVIQVSLQLVQFCINLINNELLLMLYQSTRTQTSVVYLNHVFEKLFFNYITIPSGASDTKSIGLFELMLLRCLSIYSKSTSTELSINKSTVLQKRDISEFVTFISTPYDSQSKAKAVSSFKYSVDHISDLKQLEEIVHYCVSVLERYLRPFLNEHHLLIRPSSKHILAFQSLFEELLDDQHPISLYQMILRGIEYFNGSKFKINQTSDHHVLDDLSRSRLALMLK